MITGQPIQQHQDYQVVQGLNLYKSPAGESLVTQAGVGRHLRFMEVEPSEQEGATAGSPSAFRVRLCEDDYPGWVLAPDLQKLALADRPYQPIPHTRREIEPKLPQVIAFALAALAQKHEYLWGGTISPDYDCSGLMQAAFASVGIWLPRDAYQQEAFLEAIPLEAELGEKEIYAALQPGDLVFFGSPEKATHVGLYLGFSEGYGQYIHSSGKERGRNGIGIDRLSHQGDRISRDYFNQFRGAGRVVKSYP